MHTAAHSLSKPSLFPPLITSLSAVFPFLHSLTCPYLLSLSSRERPPSAGDKENRGGGKKGQQQGGMRRERRRGETESLICDGTHTHIRTHTQGPLFGGFAAGPCDHGGWDWWTCGPSFLPPILLSSQKKPSSSLSSWAPPLPHQQEISTWKKKKKYRSGRRSWLQQHKWAHLQQVWLQGESKGLTLTLLGPPLDFPDSMSAWMSSDNGSSKLSCCGCMYCICWVQAQRFFKKRVQTNWAVSLNTLPGTLAKQEYRETISTNAIQLCNSSCVNDIGFTFSLFCLPWNPSVQKYWVDDRFHSATNCNLDDGDSGQEWRNVLRHVRKYVLFTTCEPTFDIQIQNWLYDLGTCKMTCFTILIVRTLRLRFLCIYWYSKQDTVGSHVAVLSIGVGRESILFRSVYEQGLTLVKLSVGRVEWTYGISQKCTSIQNIQFHAVTYTSFNFHYWERGQLVVPWSYFIEPYWTCDYTSASTCASTSATWLDNVTKVLSHCRVILFQKLDLGFQRI